MKKLTLVLLTVALLVFSMAVQSFALSAGDVPANEGLLTFELSKSEVGRSTADADVTFTLTISVAKNPGFASAKVYVNYDENCFEIIDVADAGNYGAALHSKTYNKNPYMPTWTNATLEDDFTNCDKMVTITFKVKEDAPFGEAEPFTLSAVNRGFLNAAMKVVTFRYDNDNGAIEIVCDHSSVTKTSTAKAATCTEEGSIDAWTCSICEKMFSDSKCTKEVAKDADGNYITAIAALGHDCKDLIAEVDSTCLTEGTVAHYVCARCSKNIDTDKETILDDVSIAKKAHVPEHKAAVEADCTNEGNIEYWYCPNCKKNYTTEDCTTEVSGSVVTPALGHEAGEWIVDEDATETSTGSRHKECIRCHITMETEVIPVKDCEHKSGLTKHEAVAATCEAEGSIEYWTCNNPGTKCKVNFSDENGNDPVDTTKTVAEGGIIIPALGHNPEHTAKVEPTCTDTGMEEYWTCTNDGCGKLFSDAKCTARIEAPVVIPALGHKAVAVDEITPTCTKTGVAAHYECSVCGELFMTEADAADNKPVTEADLILAIDPTNHGESVTEGKVEADCVTEGHTGDVKCADCGTIITADVNLGKDADKHAGPIVVEGASDPTCVAEGATGDSVCTACNAIVTASQPIAIDPTAHTALTTYEGVASTYKTDGYKTFAVCPDCGAVVVDGAEVPALKGMTPDEIKASEYVKINAGDEMQKTEARPATTVSDGVREYFYDPATGAILIVRGVADEIAAELPDAFIPVLDTVTINGVEYIVIADNVSAADIAANNIPDILKINKIVSSTSTGFVTGVIYINEQYHGILGVGIIPSYSAHIATSIIPETDGTEQWYICKYCGHEFGRTEVPTEEEDIEDISIDEPVESDNPEIEVDEPAEEVEAPAAPVETNPVTGVAMAVLPMAAAAAAAIVSKRR